MRIEIIQGDEPPHKYLVNNHVILSERQYNRLRKRVNQDSVMTVTRQCPPREKGKIA